MDQGPTYYDILQVSHDAEPEVIEAAYRHLATKYHPDLNAGAEAARSLAEIAEAYCVLQNADARRRYDYQLLLSRAGHAARDVAAEEGVQKSMAANSTTTPVPQGGKIRVAQQNHVTTPDHRQGRLSAMILVFVFGTAFALMIAQRTAPESSSPGPTPALQATPVALNCGEVPSSADSQHEAATFTRPPTSIIKESIYPGARGELLVRNGTDRDGLAIMSERTLEPVVSGFVRAGESLNLKGIPDGTYWLYFSKGSDWSTDRARFLRDVSCRRFDRELEYNTTQYYSGDYLNTQYTRFSVTLYAVPGGDAPTSAVQGQDFPAAR